MGDNVIVLIPLSEVLLEFIELSPRLISMLREVTVKKGDNVSTLYITSTNFLKVHSLFFNNIH